MNPTSLKIAYLGGGSRQWARALMADLALSPHLGGELVLHDLNHAAARKNVQVGRDLFGRPEAVGKWRVCAEPRLDTALAGADVVLISTEPGPVTMRYADLVIPARHGIVQPVGDTVGPGGLMRALRAIPTYVAFGQAIGEHCPRAWVFNYTNPMTLCTAALHVGFPAIQALGCCHEVFGTQRRLASLLAQDRGLLPVPKEEIELDIAGINHFTWATRATWRGEDLFPLLAAALAHPRALAPATRSARRHRAAGRWFESPGHVALDLFRRFGALGAAGDRHLVEFLPEYAADEPTLHRWGVVLTPYSWRLQHRSGPDDALADLAARPLAPSGEDGVRMLEALTGAGDLRANVNLPNAGQQPELPAGAIVETMAHFTCGHVTPLIPRPLCPAARNLVARTVAVQQQTLAAALARDVDAAFTALVADPLVRGSIDSLWRMFQAMLAHCAPELPGWRLPTPGRRA